MNRQNDLSVLLNEIDDYNQTVKAILAFAAFVVHDAVARRADAEFGFGRRMETSPENQIQPSTVNTGGIHLFIIFPAGGELAPHQLGDLAGQGRSAR